PGTGSALMMRGVQMKRKTIFEMEPELRKLTVPSLIVVGDQDEPCLEPGMFMKHTMPHAGFLTVPMTGHTANIEEPALFNQHVAAFLAAVEQGRSGTWTREPRRAIDGHRDDDVHARSVPRRHPCDDQGQGRALRPGRGPRSSGEAPPQSR